MASQGWTHARLLEFTAGTSVYLRSPLAESMEVPSIVLGPGAKVGTLKLADRLVSMHPADRSSFTDIFARSFNHREEVIEGTYRFRHGPQWLLERYRALNLVDHPDVAGVIVVTDTIGELDDVGLDGGVTIFEGDFLPATWVFEVLDEDANVLEIDGMTEKLFGRSREELLGTSASQWVQSEHLDVAAAMWRELLARPGTSNSAHQRLVHADGSSRWIESTLINRTQPGGRTEILNMVRDVTAEHEQEQILQQMAKEFRLLAEEVPAAVFRTDRQGRVTFHNDLWASLVRSGDVVAWLTDLFDPRDRARIVEVLEELAASDEQQEMSVRLELRGWAPGTVLALKLRCVGDRLSERQSYVGSVEDITATVRLRRRAEYDDLTGLLNRQALEDHLESVLGTGADRALVVFLDLDGFKEVNDNFGHDIGDLVLTTIAERLRRGVRPEDVVGRYGGDEFVLVCTSVEHTDSETIAGRIERIFADPITWEGGAWTPAGSVGAARPAPGETLTSIIRRADQAMLAVKRERHLRPA